MDFEWPRSAVAANGACQSNDPVLRRPTIPKIHRVFTQPQQETGVTLLQLGAILDGIPPQRLLQCDPDEIDGGVTGVAGFMPLANVDGVHPAH